MRSFVYLLTSEERFKIGFSSNPQARRSALSSRSGLDLVLYAMIPGGQKEEAETHARFEECALGEEWFEPKDHIRRWFVEHPEFIDPGLPHHPNSQPQRLIDAGLAERLWRRGEGPAIAEYRSIYGAEAVDVTGWCRIIQTVGDKRHVKNWRPPHHLDRMKEAVEMLPDLDIAIEVYDQRNPAGKES